MRTISDLFGRSPFVSLVEHARKVHECVKLVRPIAEAIVAGDMDRLTELQHEMSKTEYEADLLKDDVRKRLPTRYFLPVKREDVAGFLRQMDKMADDTEDFAVVATFRVVQMPETLAKDFMALVDKVVQVGDSLLRVAEHVATLQREAFVGAEADDVLAKIREVCQMEWESDKLSRKFARRFYASDDIDPVTIMILEKFCRSLSSIADHAENVGKNLRLMIMSK